MRGHLVGTFVGDKNEIRRSAHGRQTPESRLTGDKLQWLRAAGDARRRDGENIL